MRMPTFCKCLVVATTGSLFGLSALDAQQTTQITSPLHTGAWIVGGSANLSKTTGDFGGTSFGLAPTALALITPNVAVGGTGALGYASTDNGHTWSYGIGPSARLFLGDVSGPTLPFVSVSFFPQWNSTSVKTTLSGATTNEDSHRYVTDGSIGVTRMIATHVGLTGEAFLTHFSFSSDLPAGTVSSSQNQYGLRVGLTAFIR